MAPEAKSSTAARCVGVSTAMRSPARGWLRIVRSGKVIRAEPVTRRTGPSSETKAVR
jgi:hypothetical protein